MFRRLLYLNGLAIACVVLFHAAGMGFVAMFSWAHRYLPAAANPAAQIGTPAYFFLRFIEQTTSFSIAAFLFVSGYFIAIATSKNRETISWNIVGKRIRTLLIPYLLWSFVVIFLQISLEGRRPTPVQLLSDLALGQTNEVLYFVPLLIQFYLLAPFLVFFAKKNWKLFLGVVSLIQLAVLLLPYPLFLNLDVPNAARLSALVPKWLFLSRILWFSAGIVFGFQLEAFRSAFQRIRWAALVIALIAIPLGMLEWELYFRLSGQPWLAYRETLLDTFFSMAVIICILGFLQVQLPIARGMERLGKDSYGIYLTHYLFIEYTAKVIYRIYPQLLGYQIVLQPILILVGLGFPVAMMYFMDHSPVRRLYAYVFG
jgi:peptidoglycan/LPS O-acetylase OafA/YrhL